MNFDTGFDLNQRISYMTQILYRMKNNCLVVRMSHVPYFCFQVLQMAYRKIP